MPPTTAPPVMYLPPLWLHHVVALTAGVSANVWQHDPALEAAESVFTDPVPFEGDWSQELTAHALGPYIAGLVRGFGYVTETWCSDVLKQRFLPQEVSEDNLFLVSSFFFRHS